MMVKDRMNEREAIQVPMIEKKGTKEGVHKVLSLSLLFRSVTLWIVQEVWLQWSETLEPFVATKRIWTFVIEHILKLSIFCLTIHPKHTIIFDRFLDRFTHYNFIFNILLIQGWLDNFFFDWRA